MASNLQVDQDLNATAQSVKDQNGNTSPLALSTDAVGIGGFSVSPSDASPNAGYIRFGDNTGWMLHLGRLQEAVGAPLNTGTTGVLMTLLDKGNVGIGTTTPAAKLHVSGGAVTIANAGEGAVLLFLGIERHWQLRQFGTGPDSALELASVGGGGNKNFIINTTGGVGIGTTTPQERLEVNGNILATGDVRLAGDDCAEEFDLDEGQILDPGTVMVIGDDEQLRHCTGAYDTKVAGVLSGAGDCKPGIILGQRSSLHKRIPLALSGKAYCKVDAHYAPIALGDLLTTSPTPGHAMKATDPLKAFGAVIGKALRPLAEGQGLIPILIALQ